MSDKLSNSPEEEPISLDDSSEEMIRLDDTPEAPGDAAGKPAGLRAFGRTAAKTDGRPELKRELNNNGEGATRCRIFFSKIAVSSLQHMENQINEWLDESCYEVKHVGHSIGVMEGKTQEPNLILCVWY